MIPTVLKPDRTSAPHVRFKKVVEYVGRDDEEAHSKGQQPLGAESCGVFNMDMGCGTPKDREILWQVMSSDAAQAKYKGTAMYHFDVSWMEGEHPTREQLEGTVRHFTEGLGFGKCPVFWAVHRDTDNDHLHIVVNKVVVDEKGRCTVVEKPRFDYRVLARLAREVEIEQGWQHAPGHYVVVEPKGEKKIMLMKEAAAKGLWDENWEKQKEKSPSRNAVRADQNLGGGESFQEWVVKKPADALYKILQREGVTWDRVHETLAAHGVGIEVKGSGMVVTTALEDGRVLAAKASQLGKWASKAALEKRLGAYQSPSKKAQVLKDQAQESYRQAIGAERVGGRENSETGRGGAKEAGSSRKSGERENEGNRKVGEQEAEDKWKVGKRKFVGDQEKSQAAQETARADARKNREVRKAAREAARVKLAERFESERKAQRTELRKQRESQRAAMRERHLSERAALKSSLAGQRRRLFQVAKSQHRFVNPVELALHARERALELEKLQKRQREERLEFSRLLPKYQSTWRGWLEQQAEQGDANAQAALRGIIYQEQRKKKLQANAIGKAGVDELEEEQQKQAQVLTVARLRAEIDRKLQWVVYKSQDGKTQMVDEGHRIVVKNFHEDTLEAALRIAAAKYTNEITITGTTQFREQAARMAVHLGIGVKDEDLQQVIEDEREKIKTTPRKFQGGSSGRKSGDDRRDIEF